MTLVLTIWSREIFTGIKTENPWDFQRILEINSKRKNKEKKSKH